MKLRHLLLSTAAVLGSVGAAEAATGWYMSLGAGPNWLQDSDFSVTGGANYVGSVDFDTGFAVGSAIGYDWGRWRAEFEVAYRQNDIDAVTFGGEGVSNVGSGAWELSQMVNVLYDVPLGGKWSGSVGAGVGGVLVVADGDVIAQTSLLPDLDDYVVAGQLIAGANYELSDRWQAFADYRYFLADDPEMNFLDYLGRGASVGTFEKSDHTLLIGLRFDLQRDGAAPPPPPVKAPKQFIVFFGYNKSNLTPEAARVVADAAAAAKEYGSAAISIVGHTDTSGSASYNQALSMRRAETVKDGLAANGIPAAMISTSGRGESELMVQTGDGIKEPQNRRATIDLN